MTAASAAYKPGRIKRYRRTKADMAALRDTLVEIVAEQQPCTVRQAFYAASVLGLVKKTEGEYKNTVIRLLGQLRLDGRIPFDWIVDNTRWMRKPDTFSSLDDALNETARTYRRALWDDQDAYVEIWLEKDALAGVLCDVTYLWDVPLMVAKGSSSLSFLHSAAEAITYQEKPCYLYYFGDRDPSGLDIDRNIEKRLREFAPEAEIHFERVAVLPEHIEQYDLPTRPTKKSDSRSKKFKGRSVELDSIPSPILREMATECIERHIDRDVLEQTKVIEAEEREAAHSIIDKLNGEGVAA